jgi:hypothetical protein
MAGLALALLLYAVVSLSVQRPYQTPLDFRAATAPSYLGLLVAIAVLILAAVAPAPAIGVSSVAWGYAAGVAFVAAPQIVGIARRECVHQFEIRNLHGPREVVARELLLVGAVFPLIALCEEVVLRSALPLPKTAVPLLQWILYRASTRGRAVETAVACLFLAGLDQAVDDLGVVVGAHAAIQTLTGRLSSPGLFGDAYPLLSQLRFRSLSPRWQTAVAEIATAALLVGLAR